MTARDRIVIMVVLALAAVGAGWMFVVSPKRSEASSLNTQISTEQSALTASQSQVNAGMTARRDFSGQYAELAKLGEAVPPDDDIPSLIYQVQSAAQASHVSFRGLQLSSSSSSSSLELVDLVEFVVRFRLVRYLDCAASARSGPRSGRSPDGAVHDHAQRQLLQPVELFQQARRLRDQRERHADDPRSADVDQRDQPRAGPQRVPADHRERVRDHVHRPADRGHLRWRDTRWPRADHTGAGLDFRILDLDHAAGGGRDPGAAMSVPRNMLKELLERKLWPIALVLVIALVAVPVLLTKKAPTDIITPPTGPLPYSSGATLPAISVQTSPGNSNLTGKGRNPFTPQHVATTSTVTSRRSPRPRPRPRPRAPARRASVAAARPPPPAAAAGRAHRRPRLAPLRRRRPRPRPPRHPSPRRPR